MNIKLSFFETFAIMTDSNDKETRIQFIDVDWPAIPRVGDFVCFSDGQVRDINTGSESFKVFDVTFYVREDMTYDIQVRLIVE